MTSSKMSMSLLNNDGDDVDVFFLSRKLISLGSRSHQAHLPLWCVVSARFCLPECCVGFDAITHLFCIIWNYKYWRALWCQNLDSNLKLQDKTENYDIDSTKLFVQQFTVNLLIKLTDDKNREFACQWTKSYLLAVNTSIIAWYGVGDNWHPTGADLMYIGNT